MEKGSTLQLEAILDNSPKNPNNPTSPPKTVFLGENTNDEMAFAVIGTIRKDVPQGGSDFLRYFERLIEAEALKKLLGGK
jgi:trehalose-6-phosphatase